MTNNPKLLECLFGYHDFLTRHCVRQCRCCKVVQLYLAPEWYTIELEDVENFNLENTSYMRRLVETTVPGRQPFDKWLEYCSSGTTGKQENLDDIIFYTRVQV